MTNTKDYLKLLFDPAEHVVIGKGKYCTKSNEITEDLDLGGQYIALNPMKPGTTRADANVKEYRNFLIEFDDLGLEDQISYIQTRAIPFTSLVYSGNKSYHCVISLVDPVDSKEEYDKLVRWIYKALAEADPSCKNCSRFTRMANGTHKNGTKQTILALNDRIDLRSLKAWLNQLCEEPQEMDTNINHQYVGDNPEFRGGLHKATKGFIKTGGRRGCRQKNVYIAACDMRDCNFSLEEARFLLLNKVEEVYNREGRHPSELLIKERAIEDAYKKRQVG